ncbi:hypothetical protein TorRG33x02_167700 [Trema orientale]|uniref:Uncharacterized protein n=1 Tax=Trema orientale TaxID=63057 RepID=A0A2P5EPE3_TREOI|nr:hypothetical protein TorRG33x02_167700 [Trema orientale]
MMIHSGHEETRWTIFYETKNGEAESTQWHLSDGRTVRAAVGNGDHRSRTFESRINFGVYEVFKGH